MAIMKSFLSDQGVQCDNGFWALHSINWVSGRDTLSVVYRGYYTAQIYLSNPDAYLSVIAVDVPITLIEFAGLSPVLDQWVINNNINFVGATAI